ncbi:MAG TPA: type III PLP-dependent enzyme [Chloroflexota bacterium]
MKLNPLVLDAARDRATPLLVVDRAVLRRKYREIRDGLGAVEVFYAVKANPHPEVSRVLAEMGAGFEVSSPAELDLALEAGAAPERIISSNPVKPPAFIAEAYRRGVRFFAFDSEAEVRKLAAHAPGSMVYVRLAVDNSGAEWPLAKKYGVGPYEAVDLLEMAGRSGLVPYGITFHVGSQCLSAESWVEALCLCDEVWRALQRRGVQLEMISLGGGLPVPHLRPVPSAAEIGRAVERAMKELFAGERVRLTVEPGRALVGEAGVLVASVVGKARRGMDTWVYLDAGAFNALMETLQGFRYELLTERTGPPVRCTVAGPTCDSVDTLFADVELPELEVGDRVYVLNAGAYTLSYASSFNGFAPPEVVFVN